MHAVGRHRGAVTAIGIPMDSGEVMLNEVETVQERMRAVEELESMSSEEMLRWAVARYHPRLALASSFGAEDVVLIDMLARIRGDIRIFSLDTGRLHEETYDVMERIRARYGVKIVTYFPENAKVEILEREKGLYSFRSGVAERKECCGIRKVEPLMRALAGLDAWVTGLRREQSVTRARVHRIEFDDIRIGLVKINPLVDWSAAQVWDYIREHDVPYHVLHDQGFPSIGCSPCTRSVAPGENERAGRWWWEKPADKECGIHMSCGSGNGGPGSEA
jgi:phosphoadenosine phosphosulfate reductase